MKIIPQSVYDPVADTYYDQYVNILQPINQFGERNGTNEESDSIEIGIVPAWIDDTETSKGQCLFLELDFNDGETDGNSEYLPISLLESGESEKVGHTSLNFCRILGRYELFQRAAAASNYRQNIYE